MVYTVTLNPALDRTLSVDKLRAGESSRIRAESRYAGGKGIDVSRALAGMGIPTVAMGFVGGFDGKEFEGRLLNEGVTCDFTHIAGEIRTNVVIHEDATGRETALLAPGPAVQPSELMDLVDRVERLSGFEFLVISGSLPPGLTPAVYRRLVRLGNDKDVRTVLDASGPPLREGIRSCPTIIKPNRAELTALAGTALPDEPAIVDYCLKLQDRVPIVLVSLGPDGIIMVESGRAVAARPPSVEVRSTVGAGDCAVAGFLAGMLKDDRLEDCLRRAVAAGTAATLNDATGLCRCEDVDALLPQTKVEALKA